MRALALSVVVSCLLACGSKKNASQEETKAGTAAQNRGAEPASPPEAPPAAEQPAGPRVHSESFELVAKAQNAAYTTGSAAAFDVTLSGRGEWHVNQDFPVSVEVSGPEAVAFPKKKLQRSDAKEFGEERARFQVPFTPASAGDHKVQAKVSFAMCTEANCVMENHTLALNLPTK